MKVALVGDVHANLHALEAVLAHARQNGIETIWNSGDFLGYGAFPDEVVKRLRQERAVSIIGNYDLKVLRFRKKRDKWRQTKRPEKWFAFKWAYENLSKASRKYLQTLPEEVRLEAMGLRILLTHGSPASNQEPLSPETSQARLRELAQISESDLILCGHSHRPFVRQVDQAWFVNTGSVGRPDDGDPRACYAIMDLMPGSIAVQHYRIEYDLAGAVAAMRKRGLPEAFAQMFLQGRDFNTIMELMN